MQTKNRKGEYRYVRYVLLSYALSPGMVCGAYQNPHVLNLTFVREPSQRRPGFFCTLGNTAQFPPYGLSTAPADLRAKSRRKRRLRSEAPRCGSVCVTASALPKCSIRHPVVSALLA